MNSQQWWKLVNKLQDKHAVSRMERWEKGIFLEPGLMKPNVKMEAHRLLKVFLEKLDPNIK